MKQFEALLDSLIEPTKEGLRIVVLAIIPLLIDGVSRGTVDIRLILIAALLAGLRFLDSWLHTTGIAEKGLTRF
jgi:hypothetical protein